MNRLIAPILLASAAALVAPSAALAADHYDAYDGDFVQSDNERHHDIVDVFTFPSADQRRLVMIMNTYNRANAASMFDDKLAYTFRVRTGKESWAGKEYRFTCRFTESWQSDEAAPGQNADCTAYRVVADPKSPTGRKARAVLATRTPVDTVSQKRGALRVFAGRRADAFFGDAAGLGEMLVTRKLPDAFKGPVTNVGARNLTAITDDMSIVLEVDFAALFEETSTVFRVAAETAYARKDN